MKTEVTSLSDCKREVSIEVPAEEVAREFDKVTSDYARYASVPGFRPGRTPKSVVRTRYKENIRNEVTQHLVSHALQHAISDHKLRVVGNPSFDELKLEEGQPLALKATLEVLPDFTLTEYKGLEVTKRVPQVTEEDVEHELQQIREQYAEMVPVEGRPAQDGDFVTADLVGKYLNSEEQDITANEVQVEVGNSSVQQEFSDNLRGTTVGDERVFRVNYPEDFSSKGLAGKELEYTAKITAVRTKELPELDDEFAKGLGEFESLADLRQRLRENLEASAERHASSVLRDEVMDKLVKLNSFEAPPSLVEQQTKSRLEAILRNIFYQRMQMPNPEDLKIETLRAQAQELAVNDVRGALILEQIASQEHIEVGEEEVDQEIQQLAERNGLTLEAMKARLTKEDALDNIKDNLKNRKALDVVVAHAKITTESVARTESEHTHTHEHAADQPSENATESATEQG